MDVAPVQPAGQPVRRAASGAQPGLKGAVHPVRRQVPPDQAAEASCPGPRRGAPVGGGAPGWPGGAPVPLQTVCVRHEPPGLAGEKLDAHTRAWADRVNRSGAAYLTPATLDGRWMVRVSVGAEATERADVAAAWAAMRAEAEGPQPSQDRAAPSLKMVSAAPV